MTQEQKAKAYDEAKNIMEKYLKSGNAGVIAENTILKAFPELAEGEDERIRKECISIIDAWDKSCRLQGDYCEVAPECIAWLEKQGTSYTKRDVDDAYLEGMAFAKDELEKQNKQILANSAKTFKDEQKPAWGEEDEECLENAIMYCEWARDKAPDLPCYEASENSITWLKSIKNRINL